MVLDNESVKKITGKIIFKSSVDEIISSHKSQTIKGILNVLDSLQLSDREHQLLRKAILDQINDYTRITEHLIASIVNGNKV